MEAALLELIETRNRLRQMNDIIEKHGVYKELVDVCLSGRRGVNKIDEQNQFQLAKINNTSITKLITKPIDEKYAYANYAGVEVIMMIENGYINATKLCALDGKRFDNWLRNFTAKELIKDVENDINNDSSNRRNRIPAIVAIKGGSNQLVTGSYAHPQLVVFIASWMSPKFAVNVSKIVNNYIVEKFEQQKRLELQIKDDKIDLLNAKIDHLIQQNEHQNMQLNELTKVNINQNTQLNELTKINDSQNTQLDKLAEINKSQETKINQLLNHSEHIRGRLENTKVHYVVQTGQTKDDNIFIIFNNFKTNPLAKKPSDYEYTAFRVMRKSFMQRKLAHLQKYQYAAVIVEINNPYANSLWQRIKSDLGNRGHIDSNYISFNLLNGYSEDQLVADVISIDEVRFRI